MKLPTIFFIPGLKNVIYCHIGCFSFFKPCARNSIGHSVGWSVCPSVGLSVRGLVGSFVCLFISHAVEIFPKKTSKLHHCLCPYPCSHVYNLTSFCRLVCPSFHPSI